MDMTVIFEPQSGKPFSIEVDCFDSVLEMKEQIEKYQGISTSRQTLFFNGQVLQDDLNVLEVEIFPNSRIQLIIAPEAKKIQLQIKIPTSKMHVPLEMDENDTIGRLKENIQEMNKAVPINRLAIYSSGTELQDHWSLRDYELSDNSEIIVFYRPPPMASGSGPSGTKTARSKLKLMVLSRCETMKIPVEVDAYDTVEVLRKELEKLHCTLNFPLPPEGYFFIHKQAVMDEDRSFRWHNAMQGDTIEVFNGYLTNQ